MGDVGDACAPSKHRLVLADDHPLTSAGLAGILQSRDTMDVVATAANGLEAIAAIKALQPDCAVLDLVMPGVNGLEVVAESRRWSPSTTFAIVTGTREASLFQALVAAGVSGMFLKTPHAKCRCCNRWQRDAPIARLGKYWVSARKRWRPTVPTSCENSASTPSRRFWWRRCDEV